MESLKFFGEEDHYLRTGPLSAFLDSRAVTIQASEDGALGDAWTGKRVRAPRIVDAFADGRCRGTVGLPGKPMWFTPYTGEMRALCEEARERKCARARRVEIARRAVSLLGLVHIHARDEVIAMVTSRTIGELGFEHPKTGDQMGPAGPTAIEARGHRRFRHWPRRSIDDRYGRTYELDGELRSKASPRDTHGAAESVRPVLPIEAFEHCIYLGRLSNPDFDDAEGDYLRTLGAPDSVSLLRDLAKATGL
ncbi:MAG: hypothetical protein B7Y45_08025 [Sphingomonas sp. 28-66-16]|nr:MAG: hypothetical protein B7Y45_08025 [Sphingomonas sp. 28-66-16]